LDPIKREFHVSDTMLGLLSGLCFSLIYAVAGLPISYWADRGNRRTVITVALTAWSIATALCGVSQTFWQLALARFGLGVAEPGALPPAQSLIADYFPPGKRASPLAILIQGGSAVGWLGGVALGGYLAAVHGWRTAFVMAGIAGLVLALVVRVALSEPRTKIGFPRAHKSAESPKQAFVELRRKRSYLLLVVGLSAYSIFSYGVSIFLPSLMIRSLGASLAQVSAIWGIAIAIANVIGAVAGGWLGDRMASRDVRWYTWLPMGACALSVPAYALTLHAQTLYTFIGRDFVAELISSTGLPSAFAAVHAVCGDPRRAMAIATVMLAFTLFGSGLGPLVAGWLSDLLTSAYGIESLRYSLTAMLVFLVPAATAFWYAARFMSNDLE
jgi:predicted MFS family arabinose efflux permease